MTYTTQEAEERGWFAKEDQSSVEKMTNILTDMGVLSWSELFSHENVTINVEMPTDRPPSVIGGKCASCADQVHCFEKPTLLEEVNVTYSADSNIKNHFGG